MNSIPEGRDTATPEVQIDADIRRKSRQKSTLTASPVRLDDEARQRVVEYIGLAYQLAIRFSRHRARDVPPEELIAEAKLALTYASGRYDSTKQVPFSAYATMVIRHRLIQVVLNWRRGPKVRRLPLVLNGTVWDPPDNEIDTTPETNDLCDRIRAALPKRWYAVLYLYYGEGHTLEEIGGRLGVSRERVRQIVHRARRRARERFPDATAI